MIFKLISLACFLSPISFFLRLGISTAILICTSKNRKQSSHDYPIFIFMARRSYSFLLNIVIIQWRLQKKSVFLQTISFFFKLGLLCFGTKNNEFKLYD